MLYYVGAKGCTPELAQAKHPLEDAATEDPDERFHWKKKKQIL